METRGFFSHAFFSGNKGPLIGELWLIYNMYFLHVSIFPHVYGLNRAFHCETATLSAQTCRAGLDLHTSDQHITPTWQKAGHVHRKQRETSQFLKLKNIPPSEFILERLEAQVLAYIGRQLRAATRPATWSRVEYDKADDLRYTKS